MYYNFCIYVDWTRFDFVSVFLFFSLAFVCSIICVCVAQLVMCIFQQFSPSFWARSTTQMNCICNLFLCALRKMKQQEQREPYATRIQASAFSKFWAETTANGNQLHCHLNNKIMKLWRSLNVMQITKECTTEMEWQNNGWFQFLIF